MGPNHKTNKGNNFQDWKINSPLLYHGKLSTDFFPFQQNKNNSRFYNIATLPDIAGKSTGKSLQVVLAIIYARFRYI